MKRPTKTLLTVSSLSLSLILLGCGGSGTSITTTEDNTTLATSYKADAGRLLGSQCAQCHGTNGVSVNDWDSIAGENDLADEIFDDEPIMSVQAHGYTTEEITLMGNWFKTLSKTDD
ncbi:MAG: Unknown protein [uncultured Sulfurovum sp.]|uniref:Cytochrome c domain-containing protein n=1 Tax=uncultured Sulfurovum sp. TaxID=269237 RepID=A0A6S6S7X0_9BACT|nr:MAG: Unknown protein [uncultured Sulfurovum sp.]